MNNESQKILMGTLFILIFGMVSSLIINASPINLPVKAEGLYGQGSWACTTEAKICPDGTAVGRIPPYCQFASCSN